MKKDSLLKKGSLLQEEELAKVSGGAGTGEHSFKYEKGWVVKVNDNGLILTGKITDCYYYAAYSTNAYVVQVTEYCTVECGEEHIVGVVNICLHPHFVDVFACILLGVLFL